MLNLANRVKRRARLAANRFISRAYYAKLKNSLRGKRGFVIGNGPSLKIADLDFLTPEISIASNKIYLAFDQTKWRPTFHTMTDPLVVKKIGATIQEHVSLTHMPEFWLDDVPKCPKRIYPVRGNILAPPDSSVLFSNDMNFGTYCGWTVTYDNLQFAVHLGLNPIILIGCDHYYAGEKNIKANEPVASTASNHFIPNYRAPGELVNPAPIELMTAAYQHARKYADLNGISIYNATRGGFLEVFERRDFDSLFQKGK